MRPTLHFGGLYGDMENNDSSEVVTINPMDSSMTKTTSKAKNVSKKKQYEQLKKFFEKNKDKYSDEEDINLMRKCFLMNI